MARHESEIDQNLNDLSTRAGDIALIWWQRGSGYAQARFYELLQFLASQSNRAQQASVSTQGAPGAPPRPTTQEPPRGQIPQVRLLPCTFAMSIWQIGFINLARCFYSI